MKYIYSIYQKKQIKTWQTDIFLYILPASQFRGVTNLKRIIFMDINQKLQQLNLQVFPDIPLPPDSDFFYPSWKIDFITKILQLTITTTNSGNVFGKVRTDDPNNKPRLDPEFGKVITEGSHFTFHKHPSIEDILKKQCVALIQGGSYNIENTGTWIEGPPASEGLPRFSIVATFHGSGGTEYNSTLGQHVGIYLGADSQGIYLLSQNMEGSASNGKGGIDIRRFRFDSSHATLGANNYYRVMLCSK